MLRRLVLATTVSFIALTGALSGPAFSQTTPAPSVTVITATKGNVSETLMVTGSFAAREEVYIVPEIDGARVIEVLAEEGDMVKKGAVLVKLDQRAIDIQLLQNAASKAKNDAAIAQARTQIEQAQISADRTRRDLNRTLKLRQDGYASAEAAETKQAAQDAAISQLENARAAIGQYDAEEKNIEALRADLLLRKSRTEIVAPVDGLITRKQVKLGDAASSGKAPMFVLVKNAEIKLVAEVPEAELPRIKLEQMVKIEVSGSKQTLTGKVYLISPEVDATTRLGKVNIKLEQGQRPAIGSFGRGFVQIAATQGLTLPLTSLNFSPEGTTAYVVKDGKIEQRKVKTGLIVDDRAEVLDGVNEGEDVVARASTFVRQGDLVTPVKIGQ
jgi:HlyD family secretion protein